MREACTLEACVPRRFPEKSGGTGNLVTTHQPPATSHQPPPGNATLLRPIASFTSSWQLPSGTDRSEWRAPGGFLKRSVAIVKMIKLHPNSDFARALNITLQQSSSSVENSYTSLLRRSETMKNSFQFSVFSFQLDSLDLQLKTEN
jgi:hypothetical protein